MIKERFKLAAIHFGIAAIVVGVILALLLGVWYQAPMPTLFGLNAVVAIFLIANLIIWPGFSALVCKADKKEQRRDITIMVSLQIILSAAMIYFLYQSRPVWVTLVVDTFEIVRQKDIQDDGEIKPEFQVSFFDGYKIVGASYSQDPKVANAQKSAELDGISVAWRPVALVPLSEKKDSLTKFARPVSQLNDYNDAEKVAATLKEYPQATRFLALVGFVNDGTILTDDNFSWFRAVDLLPWEMALPEEETGGENGAASENAADENANNAAEKSDATAEKPADKTDGENSEKAADENVNNAAEKSDATAESPADKTGGENSEKAADGDVNNAAEKINAAVENPADKTSDENSEKPAE